MGNIDGSSVVSGLRPIGLTGCLGGLFRPNVLVPLCCGDNLASVLVRGKITYSSDAGHSTDTNIHLCLYTNICIAQKRPGCGR